LQIPNILEVIYAPHKAFKKMAEHPTIIAPILIIILYLVANAGYAYMNASKVYVEQMVPNGANQDEWTQNATLWTSNAQVSESSDVINGSSYLNAQYYGNASIAFSATGSAQVWMDLENIGTVNCSNPNGYDKLSFRVKWTSPTSKPVNVTIQLFSANPSNNFFKSLIDDFANSAYGSWNNETISLASEGWNSSSTSASWGSITGLRVQFTWAESSNITVLADGLFFHGPFLSGIDVYGTGYLLNVAFAGVMQFVITWVILAGLIYFMSKSFGGKIVWKIVLVVIGTTLITTVLLAVVNAIATSTVSSVSYPFELTTGFRGEAAADAAYNKIVDQTALVDVIGRYAWIAIQIWTAVLCSVVVRVLAGFSWTKSFLVGAAAYVIDLIIGSFLFGI
jgi:hypothetical protein